MSQPLIVTATEAREKFFSLLDIVEEGKKAIIVKRDRKARFTLQLLPKQKAQDTKKQLAAFSRVGLKTGRWEDMKRIIDTPQL